MGIASSTNTIQDYVNEQNNAMSTQIQNNVIQTNNVCSSNDQLTLSVGCCTGCDKNSKNCTTCTPSTISGTVNISNTNNLNCTFTSNTSIQSIQQARDTVTNSSNITASQINKTMQEALNFSASDSQNATTFIQNLLNNMFVSNVSNLNSSCNNSLFMTDKTNIYLCVDVEKGGVLNFNQVNAGDLVAVCTTNTILTQVSQLTSTNNVINTITQYNETKQYGLLGSLIGAIVCVAVILVLVYFSQKGQEQGKGEQGSNAKIVIYVLLLFFLILFIVSVALGFYFWFLPANQDIEPIVVDGSNNKIYFQTLDGNNVYQTYTAEVPKGTYRQGDSLATAIQNAMNASIYPNSSALGNLLMSISNKTFGSSTANFVVNFNSSSNDFEFECWAGDGPENTPRPNFKFVSSNGSETGNDILSSINGSNLIRAQPWTVNDNVKTGAIQTGTQRGFWFYFWIVAGILLGLFLIIGTILIIFRRKTNK